MAFPIIPLLILGGGAAWLLARKAGSVMNYNQKECSVVTLTQAQVDAKAGAIFQWAGRWRNKPDADGMACLLDFMRTLFPQCLWPPPGGADRTIGGNATMTWHALVAMTEGKTVRQLEEQGIIALGGMESVGPTGMAASAPGIKGITS